MIFQDKPKLISQTVDSLTTSHYCLDEVKFRQFETHCKGFFADLKRNAQEIDANSSDRFAAFQLGELGTFRLSAKGNPSFPYVIENNDFLVFFGSNKFGSDRPQVKVEYKSSTLFQVGYMSAYSLGKKIVKALIGINTRDIVTRLDLNSDIANIRLTPMDLYRFRVSMKKTSFYDFSKIYCHHLSRHFF